MNRRTILQIGLATVAGAVVPAAAAMPGFGKKSGGGGDWKAIAADFKSVAERLGKSSSAMLEVSSRVADALDLKSEAETLRAEAENISSKGDALGADDLDAVMELSSSANDLISAKLAESEELGAEQKAKLGEAAVTYVPALIEGIGTGRAIKDLAEKASDAGKPGMTDGRAAIDAARRIPVIAPKAIRFTTDSVRNGVQILTAMNSKGVSTPDVQEVNDQFADWIG